MNMEHIVKIGSMIAKIEGQNKANDYRISVPGIFPSARLITRKGEERLVYRNSRGRMESLRINL